MNITSSLKQKLKGETEGEMRRKLQFPACLEISQEMVVSFREVESVLGKCPRLSLPFIDL